MFRLNRLLGKYILLLLIFALPILAQQPSPRGSAERVPPPPENASEEELEQQGDLLRAQKAYLDSIDYYRAGMKKADSAVLHNKAGISFFEMHRDHEAKKEYEQAIKLDKNYAEPYNNLGALYSRDQRYGPAIREYRKAIKINEASASFHSNLGTAYFYGKDYDHATREYKRAIELDPNIFERQMSGGGAVRLISSSDLGRFHYKIAQIYGEQGDQEHCRHYLSKANEEGYPIRDALRDSEFAGMRKDPNFVAFVRSLKPPPANE